MDYAALAAALDRMHFGVIITAPAAAPAFVNLYARELIDRNDGLRVTSQGLETHRASDTRALREAIERASRRELPECVSLLLPRPKNERPLAVHVPAPKYNGAQGVAVFVCDPARPGGVDHRALTRMYGLTRAEAAFTAMLLSGMSVQEVADAQFISLNTARTHLKRILLKTETGRQAELMRLLLNSSAHLRLD